MTTMTPMQSFFVAVLLLGASLIGVNGQRGLGRRKTTQVQCASSWSSFFTYIFVDLEVKSYLDDAELFAIGEAFQVVYNQYTEENYCDILFRNVYGFEVDRYRQIDEKTDRFIITIDGRCRGCDRTAKLFSLNTRRELSSHLSRRGKKTDGDDDDDEEEDRMCTCVSSRRGYGTPSNQDFGVALEEEIVKLIGYDDIPSVVAFRGVMEVEPEPCPEETDFESEVQVQFSSFVPPEEVSMASINLLPEGFKEVYNEFQDRRCDSQHRVIDTVDATIIGTRRLEENERDLQFNLAGFVLFLNMAVRGKCRGCQVYAVLFDDALRRLQENRQSGLCFCPVGDALSTPMNAPSAEEFTVGYTNWITEERNDGRLNEILNASETVQVDPSIPSSAPSELPSLDPSSQPTGFPSTSPSSAPSAEPSSSPSAFPSSSPSAMPSSSPSSMPSSSPSSSPSSTPSSSPSSAPSSTPSSLPSAVPSAMPSWAPSTEPSSLPSDYPSNLPSDSPSSPPSVAPFTELPSASPSFSTLCTNVTDVDTQLEYQTFEDGNVSGWNNVFLDTSGSAFTTFLGPFKQGDAFPERTVTFSTTSVNMLYLSYEFYEIDSWDGDSLNGGTDGFSMKIEGGDGVVDVIIVGWFRYDYSEPSVAGNSSKSLIEWQVDSVPIEDSPQGLGEATDQKHTILLAIPPIFWENSGSVKLTIAWDLVGEKDEFVGLDNFKVTACVDVIPSMMPTVTPSLSLEPSGAI